MITPQICLHLNTFLFVAQRPPSLLTPATAIMDWLTRRTHFQSVFMSFLANDTGSGMEELGFFRLNAFLPLSRDEVGSIQLISFHIDSLCFPFSIWFPQHSHNEVIRLHHPRCTNGLIRWAPFSNLHSICHVHIALIFDHRFVLNDVPMLTLYIPESPCNIQLPLSNELKIINLIDKQMGNQIKQKCLRSMREYMKWVSERVHEGGWKWVNERVHEGRWKWVHERVHTDVLKPTGLTPRFALNVEKSGISCSILRMCSTLGWTMMCSRAYADFAPTIDLNTMTPSFVPK